MNNVLDEILGPQVAIIDNNENEIKSIEVELNELKIGNKFYEVDYIEPNYPIQPLNTVEMVFLDLYLQAGLRKFDPYMCINWLNAIVPAGKKYILIIWSNDTHEADQLMKVMKEEGAPIPFLLEIREKGKYETADYEYDIRRLFKELNEELSEKITLNSEEYYGQIILVEPKSVLINCKLFDDPPIFEVRRFDITPFQGFITPEKGMFLKITITNKPGSKTFEFVLEPTNLSESFKKPDDFEGLDLSFLDDSNDEDYL
ncbi:MAG TPA: hypothetical protein DCQ50_09005 [Chryseobacterium sp.]|nr:hypothetical protein [Chryseobacterium sp.]